MSSQQQKINEAITAHMIKDSDCTFRFDVSIDTETVMQESMQLINDSPEKELKEFAKRHLKLFPGFQNANRIPISKIKEKMNQVLRPDFSNIKGQAQFANEYNAKVLTFFNIPLDQIAALEYTRFEYKDGKILYELVADLKPQIKPVDLSNITITQHVVKISDQDVQDALKAWGQNNTKAVEAEQRTIQYGDKALIDLYVQVSGQTDTRENLMVTVGSNTLPGVEQYLVGKKPGDKIEEYPKLQPGALADPKLDGKQMIVKVKIHKIFDSVPHEVGEEMAQAMNCKDLSEAQKQMVQTLEQEVEQLNLMSARNQIENQIVELSETQLPATFIKQQAADIAKQMQNTPWGEYLKSLGPDPDMLSRFEALAKRQVLTSANLEEVQKTAQITLTAEEEESLFREHLKKMPFSEEEIQEAFKSLDPDKKIRAHLARSALEMKVFKHITEQCKVTKKETSLNDLRNSINGLVAELMTGQKSEQTEPATSIDDPVNAVESSHGEKATKPDKAVNMSESTVKEKSSKPVTNNHETGQDSSKKQKTDTTAKSQATEAASNTKKDQESSAKTKPATSNQGPGQDAAKKQKTTANNQPTEAVSNKKRDQESSAKTATNNPKTDQDSTKNQPK